ncbi:MAG: GNAT family N-acetyltransferase [Phycisphaerales bacterium]|nr:GNAT family N-acetyltransferase [Phycisphaerales bacterium]
MDRPWKLIEIARLEETRQATGIAEIADEARPVAGGVMCRGAPGTWLNTATAIGLSGPVSAEEVDEILAWYEGHELEPRVEICPYVDPTLIASLARRAFVVRMFDNVLYRDISDSAAKPGGEFAAPIPPGLEVREIDAADGALVRAFAHAVATGFCPTGIVAREEDVDLAERCARHPRCTALGAFANERCVGGGYLEVRGEIAALFYLSVLPEFRGRGIQSAMIAQRVAMAADRGARIATIGARPGVATERNVRRMGFQVAYTKVSLVRPGAGLSPVIG